MCLGRRYFDQGQLKPPDDDLKYRTGQPGARREEKSITYSSHLFFPASLLEPVDQYCLT